MNIVRLVQGAFSMKLFPLAVLDTTAAKIDPDHYSRRFSPST
ncbi:hypothetical protein [Mangrovibacter phragmitis]|nr:hypothetical protein [Mangrovibacter phragmitis]